MNLKRTVNFFFEIASLRRLTRSHRQLLAGVNDNIADHSFRVALIGLILAKIENADENKVLKMCLLHDLPEARTGDLNFINKQYVKAEALSARTDQLRHLPIFTEAREITEEYEKRASREAIIAKDADLLDQMILQQEYLYDDPGYNRRRWQSHTRREIKTDSAKKLAEQISKSNPFGWLYQLAADKKKK